MTRIYYGKDLRKLDRQILIDRFGKTGSHYYKIVRSIQDSPVNPSKENRRGRRTPKDISSEAFMLDELNSIADELERRMRKSKIRRTITVKLKYNDFTNQTKELRQLKIIFQKKRNFSNY